METPWFGMVALQSAEVYRHWLLKTETRLAIFKSESIPWPIKHPWFNLLNSHKSMTSRQNKDKFNLLNSLKSMTSRQNKDRFNLLNSLKSMTSRQNKDRWGHWHRPSHHQCKPKPTKAQTCHRVLHLIHPNTLLLVRRGKLK